MTTKGARTLLEEHIVALHGRGDGHEPTRRSDGPTEAIIAVYKGKLASACGIQQAKQCDTCLVEVIIKNEQVAKRH